MASRGKQCCSTFYFVVLRHKPCKTPACVHSKESSVLEDKAKIITEDAFIIVMVKPHWNVLLSSCVVFLNWYVLRPSFAVFSKHILFWLSCVLISLGVLWLCFGIKFTNDAYNDVLWWLSHHHYPTNELVMFLIIFCSGRMSSLCFRLHSLRFPS